ncbi:MAG: DNA polymerase III subunit gamma/tau [candidate division Zixibacteria bacterium]|nr:DNA polymerase III subunit gamma/tau [candidate division Zixibacteria bacterium]
MAYQVLALKYRPLRFEDVIAQEHVTKTLARAVATGRVAHGYLFAGPRGTGKTTTARILAKALNCIEGPTPTPCNQCSICKEITAGSSLDVLEIDAASNTGVDDVRTLRENIRYLPTSGKKRVFIIDEVHRLSGSAFDALLKTLEEPPAHAVFIFATTDPHKVPQTILSRTQRYDFRRVKTADLAAHMEKLAKLENIDVEPEALFLIARKGEGSVRDSLSLFDQMIALVDGTITRQATAETLGIVDRQIFTQLLDIIAAGKAEPVFELVQALYDSGADITEFVNDFIDYLRNLMVQKSAADPDVLLDVSAAEKEALVKQAAYFTEADILRMMQISADLLAELKKGYDERTFLEICLVRLVRMESSITLQEVIERLNRLSASAVSGAPATAGPTSLFDSVKPAAPKAASVRAPASPPPPVPMPTAQVAEAPDIPADTGRPLNLPRVQMEWSRFLDFLKRRKPMLASMLAMGKVRAVTDGVITVAFGSNYSTNKQIAEKAENKAVIEETLRDFFKLPARMEYQLDRVDTAPAETIPAREYQTLDAEEIYKDDPDLKRMIEEIDGEIIGRRKVDE